METPLSRAINAVVVAIAALIVVSGIIWFFVVGIDLADDGDGSDRDETESPSPTEDSTESASPTSSPTSSPGNNTTRSAASWPAPPDSAAPSEEGEQNYITARHA